MSRMTWVLVVDSVLAGLFELGMAPFLEFPAAAAIFGVAFLALALWLFRRAALSAVLLLGLMFLVELAFMPAYSWASLGDSIVQGSFAVLSVVGLASGAAIALSHRRRAGMATPTG